MKKTKVGCIIPVRYDSERLPGKIMIPTFENRPNIFNLIERIQKSRYVDCVILAVADDTTMIRMKEFNIALENVPPLKDFKLYIAKSDEAENVMKRTLSAAKAHDIDIIVDITADCPFVDPGLIDEMLFKLQDETTENCDYVSNVFPHRSFPDGFDIQVYTRKLYAKAYKLVKNPKLRLHTGYNISLLFKNNKLKTNIHCVSACYPYDRPEIGMTLDTPEDLVLVRRVYDFFQHNNFTYKEAIDYVLHEKLYLINRHVRRKQPEEG